jgi:Holliday junction DNA helicase RuvB
LADKALTLLRVDKEGLDAIDRQILTTMIDYYHGGPVGIGSIAATIGEDRDTIEDMYEPYLLQIGFLKRTQRGRVVAPIAYEHLGYELPKMNE